MAVVKLKTGQRKFVPEEAGVSMWLCKHGFEVPDPEQQRYLEQVSDIVLNWRYAPDEYIRRNLLRIIPQVVADWFVDPNGRPVRPARREDYIFAEKWGLWAKNKPTALVIDAQEQMQLV